MNVTKEFILDKAVVHSGTQADNIKLGDMGSWAMLFGNCNWYIPEIDTICKGTCGKHCTGCFDSKNVKNSPCYVAKSYVKYTNRNSDGTIGNIKKNKCSVKLGHAYRTIAMTKYRDELFDRLNKQLTNKKKKFKIIRINESGELTCYEDLELWCRLATRHSETIFYLYTKNYDAVQKAIDNDIIPANLYINISVWHENGIKSYNNMKDHKQIRAFVFVDKEWNVEKYKRNGLDVTSMCGAYDKNGKMNHAVTCEKCGKCFSNKNKCVGCYEH